MIGIANYLEKFSAMHRIQLKGPWQYHPLRVDNLTNLPPEMTELPPPGTIKLPANWDEFLGEFCGTVEFRRPFNCPTNLSANEQVDLVLGAVGGDANVEINGNFLGTISDLDGSGRFDITRFLRLHNEIRITLNRRVATFDPRGLWGAVSLEIRDKDLDPSDTISTRPSDQSN
jgi:hypothetical protein